MLQSLVMMINNPMLAGASGGKLETVNGQRAIVQYNEASPDGEVNIVVDNRFMVTVKGQKVDHRELLDCYAEVVDYEALAKNDLEGKGDNTAVSFSRGVLSRFFLWTMETPVASVKNWPSSCNRGFLMEQHYEQ